MTTLKDRLAASRRTHILDAALSVFAAKGYRRATIRDVAQAAGVADGTIYGSFSGKEALLLALLEPLDALASPQLPTSDATASPLRMALRQRLSAFTPRLLDALRVVLAEALVDPQLRVMLVERVLAPTWAGPVPGLPDHGGLDTPPIIPRILTASVLGLVVLRLLEEPVLGDSWDTAADTLADLLEGGLAPQKS